MAIQEQQAMRKGNGAYHLPLSVPTCGHHDLVKAAASVHLRLPRRVRLFVFVTVIGLRSDALHSASEKRPHKSQRSSQSARNVTPAVAGSSQSARNVRPTVPSSSQSARNVKPTVVSSSQSARNVKPTVPSSSQAQRTTRQRTAAATNSRTLSGEVVDDVI